MICPHHTFWCCCPVVSLNVVPSSIPEWPVSDLRVILTFAVLPCPRKYLFIVEKVACGTEGSWSPLHMPSLSLFLRSARWIQEEEGFHRFWPRSRISRLTKMERKVVIEAMRSPTQPFKAPKHKCHTSSVSVELEFLDILMIVIMIIAMEGHRKKLRATFCRFFILALRRMRTGMLMSKISVNTSKDAYKNPTDTGVLYWEDFVHVTKWI